MQSPPATGSLRPGAIGAAVEVTKPLEISIQRAVLRAALGRLRPGVDGRDAHSEGPDGAHQPLQLVVRDSALVDMALIALAGDGDGRPGGDFVGRFGPKPRA